MLHAQKVPICSSPPTSHPHRFRPQPHHLGAMSWLHMQDQAIAYEQHNRAAWLMAFLELPCWCLGPGCGLRRITCDRPHSLAKFPRTMIFWNAVTLNNPRRENNKRRAGAVTSAFGALIWRSIRSTSLRDVVMQTANALCEAVSPVLPFEMFIRNHVIGVISEFRCQTDGIRRTCQQARDTAPLEPIHRGACKRP